LKVLSTVAHWVRLMDEKWVAGWVVSLAQKKAVLRVVHLARRRAARKAVQRAVLTDQLWVANSVVSWVGSRVQRMVDLTVTWLVSSWAALMVGLLAVWKVETMVEQWVEKTVL